MTRSVGVGEVDGRPQGAERGVPERPGPGLPRADVGVRPGVPGVAWRDPVVHVAGRSVVDGDAEVEVLGPQHRREVGCDRPQGDVAGGEPIDEQRRPGLVDRQPLVGSDAGAVVVQVGGGSDVDPRRLGQLSTRASVQARDPARPGEARRRHRERQHGPGEAAGRDPQPDRAVAPVLRTGDHQFADAVQRSARRLQPSLVHRVLLVHADHCVTLSDSPPQEFYAVRRKVRRSSNVSPPHTP